MPVGFIGTMFLIGLALAFFLALPMNRGQLIPNSYMPDAVRLAHFAETVPSNFLFGPLLALSHLGLILFCGVLDWKARLTAAEPPAWAYKARGA